jgi:cytochrome c biogenesis protein CcmG, thiol:disulfide interchange protein DsbE
MSQPPPSASAIRRRAPLWLQLLAGAALLVLLIFLGIGIFRAQHPILRTGSEVPNFQLSLFDDYRYQDAGQVRLSDLRGKIVVVNFWASWCVTCADEAPYLESVWRQYRTGGQVVFLGVDYTDVDSKALDYLQKFQVTYPNGPDLGTRIAPIFNRNIAMPETYVIDRNGVLVYQQIGPFQSAAEIQSILDPLIAGR